MKLKHEVTDISHPYDDQEHQEYFFYRKVLLEQGKNRWIFMLFA